MGFGTLVTTMVVALAFVSWGIIGRMSGVPQAWAPPLVGVGSAIAIVACSAQGLISAPRPSLVGALAVLAGALANGWGMWWYGRTLADPLISNASRSTLMMVVGLLLVVLPPLIWWALPGGKMPSRDQLIGLGLAAGAIYFLQRGG